jgi:hypothetical protein
MTNPEVSIHDRQRAGVRIVEFMGESAIGIKQQLHLLRLGEGSGFYDPVFADKSRQQIEQAVGENIEAIHAVCRQYSIDLTVTGPDGISAIVTEVYGFSPDHASYGVVVGTEQDHNLLFLTEGHSLGFKLDGTYMNPFLAKPQPTTLSNLSTIAIPNQNSQILGDG